MTKHPKEILPEPYPDFIEAIELSRQTTLHGRQQTKARHMRIRAHAADTILNSTKALYLGG